MAQPEKANALKVFEKRETLEAQCERLGMKQSTWLRRATAKFAHLLPAWFATEHGINVVKAKAKAARVARGKDHDTPSIEILPEPEDELSLMERIEQAHERMVYMLDEYAAGASHVRMPRYAVNISDLRVALECADKCRDLLLGLLETRQAMHHVETHGLEGIEHGGSGEGSGAVQEVSVGVEVFGDAYPQDGERAEDQSEPEVPSATG